MGFIVEQQAKFAVDLRKLQEEQAKAESRISRLEGAVVTVVNMIGELAKAQKATDANINDLSGKIDTVTNRVDKLAERVDNLTERMDTFITVMVERFFGDQNGKEKKAT